MPEWTTRVVVRPEDSVWSPRLPGSPALSPRGMQAVRQCRLPRRIYLSTVVACGFMCFTLYILTLSCCAVVNTGMSLSRVRVYPGEVAVSADEARYQRDIQDYPDPKGQGPGSEELQAEQDAPGYLQFRRKTLLEGGDPGYVQLNVPRGEGEGESPHPRRHSHGGRAEGGTLGYNDEEGDEDFSEDFTSEDIQYNSESTEYMNSNTNSNRGYRTRTSRKNSVTKMQQGGSKVLPQALIIGVKKGGTRALLEFIRIHPDVRAPGPETHFFDKNYERGLEWYRNQMPATLDGQITMEKTPSYFVTKDVPARISNMSRDIKLIVVVRDPVTRAISDYTQALTKRSDLKPFAQMAFSDNATGVVNTSWGAIRIGVYAKHLERWLDHFSLSQIHFVNGEKLITDPAGEMAKVQDFLGLKRVINEKHFYFNSTKGFPCLKKPEGSGNPHCLGKTKGRQHPKVDAEVLKRLRDFYRPYNQKFYQMTGIDFGWP